jgi:hypothetical protein
MRSAQEGEEGEGVEEGVKGGSFDKGKKWGRNHCGKQAMCAGVPLRTIVGGSRVLARASTPRRSCFSARQLHHGTYGWTGRQSSSGFCDIARPALGVFASLDRF